MIHFLVGKICNKQPPLLILDVNGVGYEIYCPMSTFYRLAENDQTIKLLTHLIVREDAHTLYGFTQARERDLFRTLIKVNGIGPKLALTILSGMDVDDFITCIDQNDTSSLLRIPGIGKKTAARLMLDIRDTIANWSPGTDNQALASDNSDINDAINALCALGYKPNEAKTAVTKVTKQANDRESLIRLALQQMVKGIHA